MEIYFEKINGFIAHELSFVKACKVMLSDKKINSFNLVVSTKEVLNGIIAKVLGEDCVNILLEKNEVEIEYMKRKIKIYLSTERINIKNDKIPILATFITSKHLKRILNENNTDSFVFVPWLPEEEVEAKKIAEQLKTSRK